MSNILGTLSSWLTMNEDTWGTFKIFEALDRTCEMRGIRVGITRLIQMACEGQKPDTGVVYHLLKSAVLPHCKKLGFTKIGLEPLRGSAVEWLKHNRLKWPESTKSIAALDDLIPVQYKVPDITSRLF